MRPLIPSARCGAPAAGPRPAGPATVVALLVAVLAAVAAGLVATGPAWADDTWGGVSCDADPASPECVVIAVVAGDPTTGQGGSVTCTKAGVVVDCVTADGWLGADGCRYLLDPDPAPFLVVPDGHDPAAGAWYIHTCQDGQIREVFYDVWLDATDDPEVAPLLNQAQAMLDLPTPVIRINPPAPAAQIVNVPTWLWLDAPAFAPVAATAVVPGLSVTATATPVAVQWSTGDGAIVSCAGPGTPWTPGQDPAAPSPDCGHTYTTVSAPGTYPLRASITWAVAWASDTGLSGTAPALLSTTTVAVAVTDSLALITGGTP